MLVDDVSIAIKAGDGGKGAVSFKRNAQTAKGGPDGGNGGNGANIYFQGIDDILGLQQFRYKKAIRAEDGIKGGRQNLYGRNGKDTIVQVPFGTRITDIKTGEIIEIANATKVLFARGGKGGRGNNEFKSATNQTPYYAEKGTPGEEKKLHLELRLIADIGLIGLPNAGKSSLLSVLTNAKPKIGNYPFTTLEPNLGMMDSIVLADIPGLIEGASQGKGLGTEFLRHVEKTKILVHCIDSSSQHIVKDYQTVRKELENYAKALVTKPEIILLTKKDLISKEQANKSLKEIKKQNKSTFLISLYQDESITSIKTVLENTYNALGNI